MGFFSRGVSSTVDANKYLDKHNRIYFNKEIEHFEKELFKSDSPEKEYERFTKLVSSFFSKAMGISYKFTFEDLKFDAKEKNLPKETEEKIEILCDTLNEMEFDKLKITKEKLFDASSQLSRLIDYFSGDIELSRPEDKPDSAIEKKEDLPETDIKQSRIIENNDEKVIFNADKTEEALKEPKKEGFFSRLFKKKKEEKIESIHLPDASFTPEVKIEPAIPLPPDTWMAPKIEKNETPDLIKKTKKSKKGEIKTNAQAQEIKQEVPIKKTIEDELPSFDVSSALIKKEKSFEKNLEDITRSLESGKKGISEEIALIDKEKSVLRKEKRKLKNVSLSKEDKELPFFKVFDEKLNTQIKELDTKKKELLEKEKEVDEKLKSIAVMEKNLKELSKNLKEDDNILKEKTAFLDSKEAVINKIKEDLEKKYNYAIQEIDNIKNELKEKEDNFLKLQKFYQTRENRLSVEETNIIEDKRKHSKVVSTLLQKHLDIAKEDLQASEKKVEMLKEKNKSASDKLREFEKKFQNLLDEKESIKKEIESKKKYFEKLEKEFRDKDPKYEELNKELERRLGNIVSRENAIIRFENSLDKSHQEIRAKQQSMDLKEIDLKSAEKDIERLTFDIKNKEIRAAMMKKHLEKRIFSFERLRKDIMQDITNEKKEIRKIENRLSRKGYAVSKKLKKADIAEKNYNEYEKSLLDQSDMMNEGEEMRIDEISIGSGLPETSIAKPAILDILRLLNVAKDFLINNQTERARDAYLEIQRIFEDLDEEERDELYPEVMKVFRTKSKFGNSFVSQSMTMGNDNIDSLLQKFQSSVDAGDLNSSQQLYTRLQQQYLTLPKEEKGKYYSRILELYNRVLEQQVNTGVIV